MAIFRIGRYSVRPEGVDSVHQVIHRTVDLVKEHEPDTLLYLALQDKDDPNTFVHISAYSDEAAMERHVQGEVMLADFRDHLFPFVAVPATFTHYTLVDGKFLEAPLG